MWPFGRKKPPAEAAAAPGAAPGAPGQPPIPAGVVPEAAPKRKTFREWRNGVRRKFEEFRSRQRVKRGMPPEPVAELKIRLGTPSTIYTTLVALTIAFFCLGAYPWLIHADRFYGVVRDPYAPKLDPVVQQTEGEGSGEPSATPPANTDALVPTTQPGPADRTKVGGGPAPGPAPPPPAPAPGPAPGPAPTAPPRPR